MVDTIGTKQTVYSDVPPAMSMWGHGIHDIKGLEASQSAYKYHRRQKPRTCVNNDVVYLVKIVDERVLKN